MSYRLAAFMTAIALLVLTGIAVTTREASAAITDPFTQRFGVNANGAIMLRGNTNLRCPAAANGCPAGQGGTATAGFSESLNNNGYDMEQINTDSDPLTFNHSAATVTLPTGGTVLFAGLYWSADTTAGTNGVAATTPADKNKVLLSTPAGAAWNTVTADRIFNSGSLTAYQGFADVTALVSGAGNGVYQVANIQAGTGKDRYAGWALAIAYHDDAQAMHSLRIFDGFGVVSSSSNSLTIGISGFQTPHTGIVDADIGTVVYEGDLGKNGDTLQLDAAPTSDALNLANNFFNSTVSQGGGAVAGRTPAWSNLMGVDIDQFDANNKLANDATSASLTLTTTGETYYPGVVTFTTDLFAPKLVTTTTPTDLNGGDVLPGDVIEYRILVRNDGSDTASLATLIDAIPAGTTYVPNSLTIGGSPISDTGNYTPSKATFDLGTLAYNDTRYVTFQVRVNTGTAAGSSIVNVPNTTFQGTTSSMTISGIGDQSTLTVHQPNADRRAGLTVAPAVVQRAVASNAVNYTITVDNDGPHLEPEPRAVLTLPTGVTPGVTQPAGCSAAGQTVTCTLTALASGTQGTVVVPAVVDNSAATTASASVTVSGAGSDANAANNTATVNLRVNAAPQPQPENPSTGSATPVTIAVRANDTDPDDATNTLTVSVSGAPSHGSTVVNADQTVTYTPNPAWRGADTFTYTLTDPQGGTGTATVTVTTGNGVPVAFDDQIGTPAGVAVTIDVAANDTDPNGDTRTVSAVTQPPGGAGSVAISGNQVVYTPPSPMFHGPAIFTYTISDGNGGTATANVRVDVGNTTPVPADDADTVVYLGTVAVNVLANDTDPDGDGLSITGVGTPDHGSATISGGMISYIAPAGFSGDATFTYTISDGNGGTANAQVVVTVANAPPSAAAKSVSTPYRTAVTVDLVAGSSDPNGDTRSVLSTGAPGDGVVVRNANGTVTYTPNAGFSGTDHFDYTLSDGHGGTAVASVTVVVANGVPIARAEAVSVASGAPTPIDVLANDSDPNGDPLTITVDVPPSHGGVTVTAGKVVYTPVAGYHGPDTFHYTVSDGQGGTAGATVAVTVLDVAPIARPDSIATDAATPVLIRVLDNDSDANGDTLSVTATTTPAHGQVTVDADGTLTYTPASGFLGIDTFTYTVTDPDGLTDTTTVTVTVHNAPPIAVDDRFTVKPGRAATLAVLSNDVDPNTGQVLTVTSVGTAPKGTVKLAGGKIVYTPKKGATGTDTFTYVIADDHGATDTATVTVVIGVVAQPSPSPSATSTAPDKSVVAKPGTPLPITMPKTDKSGSKIKIKSLGTPQHGTVRLNSDGTVTYTPAPGFRGTDTFTYSAVNAKGVLVSGVITVRVAGADRPPTATDNRYSVVSGKSIVVRPTSDDTDPDDDFLSVVSVGRPEHGTAVVTADGGITYAPDDGRTTGLDTFTYTISDGHGGTATATVTIRVRSAGSLATTGGNISTMINTGVVILLIGGVLYTAGVHGTLPPGRHRPGRHRA
ncbi:Ig-like domain-containing protein [Actinoplanes sp. CA-015351]|uniref:Ig-like domain-containing protein n=1 Tax=Actinoplanes sp. CA-015351 TaxID=3239897 RepID=UPI003D98C581